jgi:hypothetical protein
MPTLFRYVSVDIAQKAYPPTTPASRGAIKCKKSTQIAAFDRPDIHTNCRAE